MFLIYIRLSMQRIPSRLQRIKGHLSSMILIVYVHVLRVHEVQVLATSMKGSLNISYILILFQTQFCAIDTKFTSNGKL
jgi:hypothetical protein